MGRNKGGKGSSSTKRKEKVKNRAKEKQDEEFFENQWFKNPLNDPDVYSTTDFTTAVVAYEAIPEMIQALEEAQDILKEWLLMHNQIEPDEEEEEDKEEEEGGEEVEENPFLLMKKRKRT